MTETTEATRRERRNRAARVTVVDRAELFARAVGQELKGIWSEATKTNVWQLALIALVAVAVVTSFYVEGFVDSIIR